MIEFFQFSNFNYNHHSFSVPPFLRKLTLPLVDIQDTIITHLNKGFRLRRHGIVTTIMVSKVYSIQNEAIKCNIES